MKLLNEDLYNVLRRVFGQVRVANPGMKAVRGIKQDYRTGKNKSFTKFGGEQFRVNCPFCGDTKFRLYISHLWGQKDAVTDRENLSLAICFNETKCMEEEGRYQELDDRLRAYVTRGKKFEISDGYDEGMTLMKQPWPGATVPVNALDNGHQAAAYLTEIRGYDLDFLTERWGIAYCYKSDRFRGAEGKIIIPVYMEEMLVGWQARHPGDDIPKQDRYYSCPGMQRRMIVYNWDVAQQFSYAVITEGPTDVWRVGNPGLCIFGSRISPMQFDRVARRWEQGTVILLLDGDAWEETESMRDELRGLIRHFIPVQLPDDRDPDQWDRLELWKYLVDVSAKHGVDLIALNEESNESKD